MIKLKSKCDFCRKDEKFDATFRRFLFGLFERTSFDINFTGLFIFETNKSFGKQFDTN